MNQERQNVHVVVWPLAQAHLRALAVKEYRLAAKESTEFERGRRAGRGEMAEELQNLPEAMALLNQEDERAKDEAR